ncbi:MAG: carbamoyltransferase HypF [Kiloniellales bacterium]|nr:carbamoyltransferase HypF [Kiloniellales bacterium]
MQPLATERTQSGDQERLRVRVRGRVQGVGFRPFVFGLADEHGLSGWVRNDNEGVLVEVEGASCTAFLQDLEARPPELARIDRIEVDRLSPTGGAAFEIRTSVTDAAAATMIGPDTATCEACLTEMFDPTDRRYRYPFVNCTHCGPRYTITRALPYDRPQTSMAGFPLCPACACEYADPADRRFHAQPLACPVCGPRLSEPVERILARLRRGEIVALKGIGGYHLACDARNARSVARLRARKDREAKPFAVMVAGLSSARRIARLCDADADLLRDRGRPIVVLPRRADADLAAGIAPDLASVGIMLPYAPLHFLLFHEAAGRPQGTAWLEQAPPDLALVMTSANPGGEPLITDDAEARTRLAGIADAVVGHDRPIVVRADDSVIQGGAAPTVIRRGRGMTPNPIPLARAVPSVLAVGGHLKATVCLTRDRQAFLSQHVGDLDSVEARRFLLETIEHLLSILQVRPEAVAHDLHPDFFTTRYARGLGLPSVPVQHHHAHIAAVSAEHGRRGPLLGLALDGMGFGPDGTVWGGELLLLEGTEVTRLGHLRQLQQPGGDIAAREPWRMAAAALHLLDRDEETLGRFGRIGPASAVRSLLRSGTAVTPTSSLGRWFDAAAALLGVVPVAAYEGHAAMVLESLVETPRTMPEGWTLAPDGTLDLLPLLDKLAGMAPRPGAELWHGTLAAGLSAWAAQAVDSTGVRTVALSGGCLLNRVLRIHLAADLEARGIEVLLPRAAPPGDGGISLGQAWIAAQTMERT